MRLRLPTYSPETFGVRSAVRVPRTDDTVPYCVRRSLMIRCRIDQTFFLRFFCYLSGTYLMQTLITEGARNACEHRLPPGSRTDRARLVTLYTDEQFYS